MIGDAGGSAIGMPKENVTALLPYSLKPQMQQDGTHCFVGIIRSLPNAVSTSLRNYSIRPSLIPLDDQPIALLDHGAQSPGESIHNFDRCRGRFERFFVSAGLAIFLKRPRAVWRQEPDDLPHGPQALAESRLDVYHHRSIGRVGVGSRGKR